MNRRRFLELGAGLSSGLLSRGAASPQGGPELRKVKSVIWIWMGGGPSQLDTWDPKSGSPNGGGLKAIDTPVPGIRISELLPVCASQMERLTLIRSVMTAVPDHEQAEYLLHCGLFPSCWDVDFSLGSILAYELWNRQSGAPPFAAIDPPHIPEAEELGTEFLPLLIRDLSQDFTRRPEAAARALLEQQDKEWSAGRQQKGSAAFAESRARADRWTDSSWTKALILDDEPEDLKRAYGGRFGQNCLRARRLVQAGVAVVEVGLQGWDTHDHHALRIRKLCRSLDAGLGTLVRDLAEKDLLKDTVVICLGEFGRSPRFNEAKGRDHWTSGFSAVLTGGSLAGGRVYGDTGDDGTACVNPVPVHNLFSTLLLACGVDGNRKYERMGRKNKYVSQNGNTVTSGTPIRALF
ncbi:MAG: DUF1501 domain-containing protein [Planctomycetes bacterium]|nr:DUF1501 domain-containing protein [Planctomycetota bacterium]